MFFDLTAALNVLLQSNTPFVVANQARPGSRYIFNSILPEQLRQDYHISGGNMTIRTTMAGLVGMDAPYPPGGAVSSTTFEEQTAKVANDVRLNEQQLRDLQAMIIRLQATGGNTNQEIIRTALNFLDKVIIQAHLDTAEWLRGQAITTGAISWTYNKKKLEVDYGIPAGNKLTARTGNDGYGGSTSKFWTDLRAGRRLLGGEVRAWLMHPDTKEMVIANDANNIEIISEASDTGAFSIRRIVSRQGNTQLSTDARDRAAFITYGDEGEIWDLANPGATTKIPFLPRGVIVGVGNFIANRFQVGVGSTEPPPQNTLGYTHIAPTVEGGGAPGRWARLFTPEGQPWMLAGQGVTNLLPVIEAPERIVILTTEMV